MPITSGTKLGPYEGGSALNLAERSPATAKFYDNAPVGRFPRRTPRCQGGRGPALELAERSPAKANSYENAPVTRFPRGSEVYRARDTKLNREGERALFPS